VRTVDGLVDQLRSAEGAGFDVGVNQTRIVVNRWIKRLAVASLWVRDERELGPTTAGADRYVIPPDIVEIHDLLVGDELAARKSVEDLFQLRSATAFLTGGPPWTVYADRASSTEQKLLMIYPPPETDGISITALCAITPAELEGGDTPPFPDDHEDTILNGAKSTLYREIDENPDEGDRYEAMFTAQAELLRKQRNLRVGAGAFRIPSYRDVAP
jgi:hypothetical protein